MLSSIKNALFPYDPNDHGVQEGAVSVTTSIPGTYSFAWSNGMSGSAITAIPSGTYTVTATESNGCTATKSFVVGSCNDYYEYIDQDGYISKAPISIAEDFELNITGGVPLAGQTQMTLGILLKKEFEQAFSAIPEGYSIQWTDQVGNVLGNGPSLTLPTVNLQFQSPISVKVSNGCVEKTKSESILVGCDNESPLTLVNKFIYQLESSCLVNNVDAKSGRVVFNILQSRLVGDNPLKIWVDNIMVTATASTVSGFVEVTKLSTGNHNIKIQVGDCDYIFSVNLDASVAKYVWSGFRNEKCYYSLLCGDRLQTINVNPVKSYEDSFEGGKCTFNNICNLDGIARNVGSGKDDFVETKAGIYLQILKKAKIDPPNGVSIGFINDMIRKTDDLKPCNNVKFCPVTLKKISHDSPLEVLFVKEADFFCSSNTLTLTCGNASRPEDRLLQISGIPDEECCFDDVKKTKESRFIPFKLLLEEYKNLNKEAFYQSHPGFHSSELENTLIQYQNSNDQRINCATIEVCLLDFKVKSIDIEEVECGVFVDITDVNGGEFDGTSCSQIASSIYACKKIGRPLGYFLDNKTFNGSKIFPFAPETDNQERSFNNNESNYSLMTTIDSNNIQFKYFVDSTDIEVLKGFYPIVAEQFTCPKAIIEVSNQSNVLYDYSHAIDEVEKESFPGVSYKTDDWDTNLSASIHRLTGKEYALNYVSASKAWYSPISSDSMLSIDFLAMQDSSSLIGGHFFGSLTFNDSTLNQHSYENLASLFLMKISASGLVEAIQILEGIDTLYKPLFVKDKQGQILASTRAKGKWIGLNEENFELAFDQAGLILKYDTAFNTQILKQVSMSTQSQMADLAYSADGNDFAISLTKVNTIVDEQSVMTASLGSNFAILSFSADGSPLWQRIWSGDSINTNKTALAFGKNSELFAGLTFAGSIVSLSDSLSSRGGYDIALVKFQQNGTTNLSYTYGTADDENVSQLLYDQQVLFFGGEISGNTKIREIGKYHFVNFTPFNDRAYVSYIPDTLPAPPTGELLQLDDTKVLAKTPAKTTKNVLKVFPNPFMDNLKTEFQLESAGSMRILMLNELGKVVQSQNFEGYRGSNSVNLSTRGLPPGVYIIQVVDSTGQMFGVEKVVKI